VLAANAKYVQSFGDKGKLPLPPARRFAILTCMDARLHPGKYDVGKGPGSVAGKYIKWHTISNLEQSVVDDVQRIRSHPLVPGNIPIYGYIYDVKTGRLVEVPAAAAAGKVRENRGLHV